MRPAHDPHAAEPIPAAAEAEILAMLRSGDLFRYTAPSDSAVSRLEQEFSDFTDVPFALAVNSCSSALFLSLRALGLGAGERVLIPAFTFAAVPSAVVHAGCEPVLVNVTDNYRVDIGEFEAKLAQGVRAVVISHMRGHTSDMDAILRLCAARRVPLVEDAAHSLGATWSGRLVGTMGAIGCFSFQSYKLINAGEGGMLITRDPDLMARAIIMSGAYEYNWKKHPIVISRCRFWQNKLPLFNLRMSNLTAAAARPQIADVPRRARDGRANHDHLAAILNASPWLSVPPPLDKEVRAPDSIQFNLRGFDTADAEAFQKLAQRRGVPVQVFGLTEDNARAFWNWRFIGPQPDLSPTREVLNRACDVRLPVQLSPDQLDAIGAALVAAAEDVRTEGAGGRRSSLSA
jgi:dTDP-4-amino-4,6-dideoxygalactose transaminase